MSTKRISQLDGVRGLAILTVVIYHSGHADILWLGVDLFFILSSFLITGILLKAKTKSGFGAYIANFYNRRARRILAPYLLTLAVISIFFGLAWTKYWYLFLGLNNLQIPLHVVVAYPFGPMWSLAVEEQFYLVWPLAVFFLNRKQLMWIAVGMIVLAPILRSLFIFESYHTIYILPWFRMDLLATGALLALTERKEGVVTAIQGWGLMVIGGAGLAILTAMGLSKESNTHVTNVFLYESTLVLCLGCVFWALSGWMVGILRWKPLRYLGTISYTVYLTHMLFLSMNFSMYRKVALTLVYATLSWFLLEKPLLGDRSIITFLQTRFAGKMAEAEVGVAN